MSITNTAKPSTSLANLDRVSFGETWDNNDDSWDQDTTTWDQSGSLVTNIGTKFYYIDSYGESNQNLSEILRVGAFPLRSSRGGVFSVPAITVLSTCILYLKKTGAPTGNAVIRIYDMTGTFGSSGKPNSGASPLASSGNFDVSTLTTSYALTTFTFTSTNQISLAIGNYCYALEYTGGDGSNNISVGENLSAAPHPSGHNAFASSDQSVWTSNNTISPCFYLYGAGSRLSNLSKPS